MPLVYLLDNQHGLGRSTSCGALRNYGIFFSFSFNEKDGNIHCLEEEEEEEGFH